MKFMVKVLVFYDSKYGNTKQVAEKIAEGLKNEGIETNLAYVKEVRFDNDFCADAFVFGAPNHMGRPSHAMKAFIGRLAKFACKTEKATVFGTYAGRERLQDRAERKLEKLVNEKLHMKLVVPGLSVRVHGVSGPVFENELPKCVEYGRAIAAKLKT